MIEDLLPVLDAFARAVKAHDDPAYEEYRKGLELIHRQLWDILARNGLERIQAAGKPFDPHFHQAIERVESRAPGRTVVDVLQDGFLLHGRVLRPEHGPRFRTPQATPMAASPPRSGKAIDCFCG